MGVKISKPGIKRKFGKQAHYIESSVLDAALQDLLNDPAQIAHDLNLKHVNDTRFRQCKEFIHACHAVAKWQLKKCDLPGPADFYIGEIMSELSFVVADMVALGDLMTARRLLPVVENYQRALDVYGPFICPDGQKRQSIERILVKHKAHALLEMVAALYPKWDTILKIKNRRQIEMLAAEHLSALLLSKETWTHERKWQDNSGKWRTKNHVESKNHPLATLVENVFGIREAEAARINLFVEYLRQGWLWGLAGEAGKPGSGETFKKCPWHGSKKLPAVNNWPAWLATMRSFLRQATAGDANRLSVFRYFLATRKGVYATKEKGRLAGDRPEYIWNQVENRIGKAWVQMAKREHKRDLKKAG